MFCIAKKKKKSNQSWHFLDTKMLRVFDFFFRKNSRGVVGRIRRNDTIVDILSLISVSKVYKKIY